jgi:hypothetical protein
MVVGQTGGAQLFDRLVGAGHGDHGPARGGDDGGGRGRRGGLAVPGGGDEGPQRRAGTAQAARCIGLIGPEAG